MRKILFVLVALILTVKPVFGAGHDEDCSDCHNLHDAKAAFSIAVKPDTTITNPYTNQKLSGQSAICMGCHNGSAGPEVNMIKTHPIGIKPNPDRAVVDASLLSKEGIFQCSSCHDFHPANTNYKYLRVDVKPANIGLFCALCHSTKRPKDAPKPKLE